MIRETRTASIPDIRDDNVLDVLRAIKSTLEVREGRIGDRLDKSVTLRDLVALNVAYQSPSGESTSSGGSSLPVIPTTPGLSNGYNPATDYTTPPAPTGLTATGGFTNVYLEWNGAPYRNHAYAEVWRSSVNNIGTAVLVGTTSSSTYADPANAGFTYYYWVRFVSKANVTGPYNNANGVAATTVIDVSSAYDEIFAATVANGSYASPVPFIFLASPTTLNGITYPAGTWIKDSFIGNATITSAKIRELTADKITTGSLTASIGISTGQIYGGVSPGFYQPGHPFFGTGFYLGNNGGTYKFYIGSPDQNVLWDGTTLSVKGTVTASAGSIGGIVLASNSAYSANFAQGGYDVGTTGFRLNSTGTIEVGRMYGGSFGASYNWPAAGSTGGGFYLGTEGLLLGNANNGKYLQVTSDGNIYAPGLSIVNGSATFSGALSAASGTFSGSLEANRYRLYRGPDPDLGGATATQGGVFVDPALSDSYILNSTPVSSFSYSGTTVWNGSSIIITSENVKFVATTSTAVPRNRRVRTGRVRFVVTAVGMVDHFFSLWYRQGSYDDPGVTNVDFVPFVNLTQVVEPQSDYGAASAVYEIVLDLALGPTQAVQFGMSACNSARGYADGSKNNINYGTLVVTATNF